MTIEFAAPTYSDGRLVCPNQVGHPLTDHHMIVIEPRNSDALLAFCPKCPDYAVELGSTAWYDNHANLALLVDWLGTFADVAHVLEGPWKWEDEFRAAKAAETHGAITGHEVNKDADGDCLWYCDECARRHGYDHEHCHHDHPTDRADYFCCVCDHEDACPKELERQAAEDRDPEMSAVAS